MEKQEVKYSKKEIFSILDDAKKLVREGTTIASLKTGLLEKDALEAMKYKFLINTIFEAGIDYIKDVMNDLENTKLKEEIDVSKQKETSKKDGEDDVEEKVDNIYDKLLKSLLLH